MNVTDKCRKAMKNISKFKVISNKEKKIKMSKIMIFEKLWAALVVPRPFLKKINRDIHCQRNEQR